MAYWLKQHCGPVFKVIESLCGYGVYHLHRKQIEKALQQAELRGSITGRAAIIRPLKSDDIEQLLAFYETLPEGHFKYFRPHGFSRRDIVKVLERPYYLAYGLFIEGELVGYSLFKLYPGRKAFFGRMLSMQLTGCGLGKFLSLYLQWQCRIMGYRMRGTINMQNSPSVGSHKAVGGFNILGDLPNGYTLIEFPIDAMPESAPVLNVSCS